MWHSVDLWIQNSQITSSSCGASCSMTSLNLWFPILVTHYNHLGISFFNHRCFGPTPGVYKNLPGDCIEQSAFRTTGLTPYRPLWMTSVIPIDGSLPTFLILKRLAAVQTRWAPNRFFLHDVIREIKLFGRASKHKSPIFEVRKQYSLTNSKRF